MTASLKSPPILILFRCRGKQMGEKTDSQARTVVDFFNIMIASGRVPNFSREWKFGRARGVDGESDLWSYGGVYSFQSVEDYIMLSSNNIGDKPSMTGAFSVVVYGLDKNWKLKNETVELDGMIPVKSKFQYIRVFRAEVKYAGSHGGNIGTISLKDESESIVRAEIQPCCNQTLMAIYTIPEGYVGYLVRYYTNLLPKTPVTEVETELHIRPFGEVFRIKDPLGLSDSCAHIPQYYDIPLGPYHGKTDIKLHLHSNQAADVCGGFLLVLEKGGKTYFSHE